MVMMINNENTAKDENQMRTGCSMYPLTLQIDEGVRRKAFTASILIRTGTGAHHHPTTHGALLISTSTCNQMDNLHSNDGTAEINVEVSLNFIIILKTNFNKVLVHHGYLSNNPAKARCNIMHNTILFEGDTYHSTGTRHTVHKLSKQTT